MTDEFLIFLEIGFGFHYFRGFWVWVAEANSRIVEAGCRVIVPDQRGYSLSDKPKGVRSYEVYSLVEDIIGLSNALEYEKVNLAGHDGVRSLRGYWQTNILNDCTNSVS